MAIYHCSTKPISRSTGRSSVAAAAYRSGQQLVDDRTGQKHDFTKKRGVEYTNIITPHDIEVSRAELWNAAEETENRKDARTAREWLVALPDELTHQQRIDLVNQFGRSLSNRYGAAIDIAIHKPDKGGDQRNYHAHILMTTREVHAVDNRLQLGAKTSLELSNTKREKLGLCRTDDEIKIIREAWASHTNEALERAGKSERIDHRSNAVRGIEHEPTIHEGVTATAMKRRGIDTAPVIYNKNIKHLNHEREQLKSAVHNFNKELDTLTTERMDIEKQRATYHLDKPEVKEYTDKLDAIMANLEASDAILQSIDGGISQQNTLNHIEHVKLSREIASRQLIVKEYTKEQVHAAAEAAVRKFDAAVDEKVGRRRRLAGEVPNLNQDKAWATVHVKREQPALAQRAEKAKKYLERMANQQEAGVDDVTPIAQPEREVRQHRRVRPK